MTQANPAEPEKKRRVRCAVYTRKSTAEGLQQEFNSLDAQREACEKFIESQKGEGWTLHPEQYSDGGFTGANTDRPALQKLLGDVRAGRVDCVMVYKIDRLSRSLLDFSKMIEIFDQHQVAFVSVTQQFNTNTSMGRLTMNVLLSFAQFEREIISERTRDKMAAARKKGKWMGGVPPLGYDRTQDTKKLVVNPAEAKIIREAFALYLNLRSIRLVAREMNARGYQVKIYTTKGGKERGGGAFRVTNVQHILANPVYVGKILSEGELYPAEHEAILGEDVFHAVEEMRAASRRHRSGPTPKGPSSLLKGILQCKCCGYAMIHSYTQKNGKRYRYYICSSAQKRGYDTCPEPSVNAQSLEEAASTCLKRIMDGQEGLKEFFDFTWDHLFPVERARVFKTVVRRVEFDGKTGNLHLAMSERGIQSLLSELETGRAATE